MTKPMLRKWQPKSRAFEFVIKEFKSLSLEELRPLTQVVQDETVRAISLRDSQDLGGDFLKRLDGDWQAYPLEIKMQRHRIADRSTGFLLHRLKEFAAKPEATARTGNIVVLAIGDRFGAILFENKADASLFKLEEQPM